VSRAARIRGALYGLACGDALGATLEFVPAAVVRAAYGPGGLREIVGGGWLRLPPGATTDDTAMALCVAEGILAAGRDAPVPDIVDAVGERFVRWYESGPPDVGATVARAIQAFQRCGSWDAASAAVAATLGDRAAGNGALMRTLPVSFFWPGDPGRTVAVSRALTRMTHPAAAAEWCSAYYNVLVLRLLRGEGPLDVAMAEAAGDMQRIAPDLDATGLWAHVQAAGRLSRGAVENPTGYSVRTLIAALWTVLRGATAEDAIVLAANLGGDTDTVAAVAGGVGGALWGSAPCRRDGSGSPELHRALARHDHALRRGPLLHHRHLRPARARRPPRARPRRHGARPARGPPDRPAPGRRPPPGPPGLGRAGARRPGWRDPRLRGRPPPRRRPRCCPPPSPPDRRRPARGGLTRTPPSPARRVSGRSGQLLRALTSAGWTRRGRRGPAARDRHARPCPKRVSGTRPGVPARQRHSHHSGSCPEGPPCEHLAPPPQSPGGHRLPPLDTGSRGTV